MNPEDFESSRFGGVHLDTDRGAYWYDPAPLPEDLPLEDETLIALSLADAAVGRLDGIVQGLPNPDLIVGPYAAREAVASSRIEGTHATLTEMYEAEAGKARAHFEDVKAIQAHSAALDFGMNAVKEQPLDLEILKQVHKILMAGQPAEQHAGRWREDYVWVGSPTGGFETATFIPPIASRVPGLLDQWASWHARSPRLPLLIRVALLHYQFLTIHPFVDGNGRVGRMLIQMILEEEEALNAPLLYVSAYFAKDRREYYDRLQAVRQHGEIQQWLQYFLTAVKVQANDGVARARALHRLRDEYHHELAGVRSRAREVVDLLFRRPVVSARHVRSELEISNQGAINLLRGLQDRGILEEIGIAGRGGTRFWWAPKILDLFDDELPKAEQQPVGD